MIEKEHKKISKKPDLLSLLESQVLLCDGAMGTTLISMGLSTSPDSPNLFKDGVQILSDIHLKYFEAGSDIVETNTFSANPAKLKSFGLESEVEKINSSAVDAAKDAIKRFKESGCKRPLYIAGSVGPLGQLIAPYGKVSAKEADDSFGQQIQALVESGVDLIMIETMIDLREAIAAVKAAREISEKIPVACSMTFTKNGVSVMGNKAGPSIREIFDAGADIAGANCSVGSDSMLNIIEKIREANPEGCLFFQPNAGLPKFEDGKTFYTETPEIMAKNIRKYMEYKPCIVGACCGSTHEHIRAIAAVIR